MGSDPAKKGTIVGLKSCFPRIHLCTVGPELGFCEVLNYSARQSGTQEVKHNFPQALTPALSGHYNVYEELPVVEGRYWEPYKAEKLYFNFSRIHEQQVGCEQKQQWATYHVEYLEPDGDEAVDAEEGVEEAVSEVDGPVPQRR